jgi:hypothetical protein
VGSTPEEASAEVRALPANRVPPRARQAELADVELDMRAESCSGSSPLLSHQANQHVAADDLDVSGLEELPKLLRSAGVLELHLINLERVQLAVAEAVACVGHVREEFGKLRLGKQPRCCVLADALTLVTRVRPVRTIRWKTGAARAQRGRSARVVRRVAVCLGGKALEEVSASPRWIRRPRRPRSR